MYLRLLVLGGGASVALALVVATFLSRNNTYSEFSSWSPIQNLERLSRQEQRERELEEQVQSLHRRLVLKASLAEDLIHHRRTLREAPC